METLVLEVDVINANVFQVALRSQFDVELTNDTQVKAASPSPSAVIHHPSESYVSTNRGGSSLGDAELFSKILNPVLLPKITGTYAKGDPFLAKLQEIDRDIKKFDLVPYENPSDLSASVSSIDGLGAARDKVKEIVDNPLPVGPQVNEPILPSSEVNRSISRPSL